jgi:hypothetical protein
MLILPAGSSPLHSESDHISEDAAFDGIQGMLRTLKLFNQVATEQSLRRYGTKGRKLCSSDEDESWHKRLRRPDACQPATYPRSVV